MRRGEDEYTDDPGSRHPVDIAALRADDALIDELAAGVVRLPRQRAGRIERPDVEDELVAMLSAWVTEVRPEAVAAQDPTAARPVVARLAPATVTAAAHGTAAAALVPGANGSGANGSGANGSGANGSAANGTGLAHSHAAVPPLPTDVVRGVASWSPPYARWLAAAAAVVVLGSSGLAVGASTAEPGEMLWAVSKVFYAERARSVEAAAAVSTGLEQARTALLQGRPAEAAQAIAAARAQLGVVRPDEGLADLERRALMLSAALSDPTILATPKPGAGTDPRAESPGTSGSGGSGTDPSTSGTSEPGAGAGVPTTSAPDVAAPPVPLDLDPRAILPGGPIAGLDELLGDIATGLPTPPRFPRPTRPPVDETTPRATPTPRPTPSDDPTAAPPTDQVDPPPVEVIILTPTPAPPTTTPGSGSTTDPKAVDPKTVDPKTVDPKTVDPKTVDPKTIDPKTGAPMNAAPANAGTGSAPAGGADAPADGAEPEGSLLSSVSDFFASLVGR